MAPSATSPQPGPATPIPVLLARRAAEDPDGSLIDCIGGGGYRNAEFHRAALRLAHGLRELGVETGDRVAVMLEPDPIAHVCWIGTSWLRAVEVPINPDFRGRTLLHALNDSQATILITSSESLRRVEQALPDLPHLRHVLVVESDVPVTGMTVRSLHDLLAGPELEIDVLPREQDPYGIIYTSGTTGPSKGVVMPWGSLAVAMPQMFPDDRPEWYSNGAVYSPWPVFHAAAKGMLTYAVLFGLRVVMRRRFSATAFWDDVRNHGCTHVHLLGMAPTLSSRPEKPDDADNPLRRVLMVPLAADYRAFEQRFGVRVSTGWGMTEIGFPVATADPPNAEACGRRSPAYEAKIVDADDYEVPDGEIGELVVRPRKPWTTMLGYFNNGEATARTWRNGWLHTADALRRDPDGNYYFVDRKADYLRTRGNNVSSVEVETEVRAHPEITDCACVAVPSDLSRLTGHTSRPAVMGDDDIKIVASRGQGSTLTEAQLLAYLVPRLPRYVIPRYIEFVDEFPRTPTGKIQKAVLRETVRETTGWDRVAAGVELPR